MKEVISSAGKYIAGVYKIIPKYPIIFEYNYFRPKIDDDLIDAWWKDHPQYDRYSRHHVLTTYAPFNDNFNNTEWYEWYYSIDGENFLLFENRKSKPFNYQKARRYDNILGPWVYDEVMEKNPEKIWHILHFLDFEYRSKWCSCKKFKYNNENWVGEGEQQRYKIEGKLPQNVLDKVFEKNAKCENCPFLIFIRSEQGVGEAKGQRRSERLEGGK